MADKLASMGLEFAAVYTSDLHRALDTAQSIAEKCQCSKVWMISEIISSESQFLRRVLHLYAL